MGVEMIFGNLATAELSEKFPGFFKMLEDEFDNSYILLKDRMESLEPEEAKKTLFDFFCNIALNELYSKKNENLISNVNRFEVLNQNLDKDTEIAYILLSSFIKNSISSFILFWSNSIMAQSNEIPEELKHLRDEYINLFLYFDNYTETNPLLIHACQIYKDNKSKTHPRTKRIGIFKKQAIEQAQRIGKYLKSDTYKKRKKYLQKELGKLLQKVDSIQSKTQSKS